MGGLSIGHLLLLTVIALIFFGPTRLPGLGKSLGEAIRGFKEGIGGDEKPQVRSRKDDEPS
ncbi:MAG: twin-arginine translocase TatA/TatE family subunit [Bdellovibrionales bacterium]